MPKHVRKAVEESEYLLGGCRSKYIFKMEDTTSEIYKVKQILLFPVKQKYSTIKYKFIFKESGTPTLRGKEL